MDKDLGDVCVYIMEYYPAMTEKEILPFASTWMDLECVMLSEPDRERQILVSLIYRIYGGKKSQIHRKKVEKWLLGAGGNKERLVKGYKLSGIR